MKNPNLILASLGMAFLFYSCDKNEFPPEIADQEFTIAENSPEGTLIGLIEASDADEGQALSFEIIDGNDHNSFQIDASTGLLSVLDPAYLNYEEATEHLITVAASDNHDKDPMESSAAVKIILYDVNEFSPSIEVQSLTISENPVNGQIIGEILADDAESHQDIVYRITGGNDSGYVRIDSISGTLSVLDSSAFDYELRQEIELTIQVSDNHPNSLSSSATLSIEIEDIFEFTDLMVAYLPFTGGPDDATGNGNDGIVQNAVLTTDRWDNANQAYAFDGDGDYIVLQNDFDYPERTINVWFNAKQVPVWNYSINPDNSMGLIYSSDHPNLENGLTKIWVTNNEGKDLLCFYNGNKNVILEYTAEIDILTWHMATVVITPSTIDYYMDGNLIDSRDFPGNIHSSDDNGFYVTTIGAGRLQNHRYFNGSLDDIHIFDSALSADEVKSLFELN